MEGGGRKGGGFPPEWSGECLVVLATRLEDLLPTFLTCSSSRCRIDIVKVRLLPGGRERERVSDTPHHTHAAACAALPVNLSEALETLVEKQFSAMRTHLDRRLDAVMEVLVGQTERLQRLEQHLVPKPRLEALEQHLVPNPHLEFLSSTRLNSAQA